MKIASSSYYNAYPIQVIQFKTRTEITRITIKLYYKNNNNNKNYKNNNEII